MSTENELEKKEKVSELLLLYGKLLTENISHRMEMFYLEDYSITEISQLENVSRNAVFESLSHGEKQLLRYEEKLSLQKKHAVLLEKLDELSKEKDEARREELIQYLKGEFGYGI